MKGILAQILARPMMAYGPGLAAWATRLGSALPENPGEAWAAQNRAALGDDETDIWGNPAPKMTVVEGTAIIPIKGVMLKGATKFEQWLGYVAHERVSANLDRAEADSSVERVALDIASPGGTVAGTPELADQVAASTKPVYAFVDEICASAAFYVAAGCTRIYATPSAIVGSVGVILTVTSFEQYLKDAGVQVDMFTSGALKATGNSFKPPTPDQAEYLQATVDERAASFKAFVKRFRPNTPESAMQGQAFSAAAARKVGMVDGVVRSWADFGTGLYSGNGVATDREDFASMTKEQLWAHYQTLDARSKRQFWLANKTRM